MDLPGSQWYLARMSVRVLRLSEEPIGILVMGPHGRLWSMLNERITLEDLPDPDSLLSSPAFVNLTATALSMAKIHVIAVHPDQQNRGHGRRLLREAVRIGGVDGVTMLYGQFDSHRHHLRQFYMGGGFEVLEAGAPLSLYPATGKAEDVMVPQPTETYFYTRPRQ
ncbi:hypothetical protein QQ25_02540 [Mycolicibacterium setense]|nr:hypothetical protein QQ25_02540 [Mycolicibacterium setense]